MVFGPPPAHTNAVVRFYDGAARATLIPNLKVGIAGVRLSERAAIIGVEGRGENGLLPAKSFKRVCIAGPRSEVVLSACGQRLSREPTCAVMQGCALSCC